MPVQISVAVNANAPNLRAKRTGFVIGTSVQFVYTISGLLVGETIDLAWLTVKSTPALPDGSGIQAAITPLASVPGQIVLFVCTFNLLDTQTVLLNSSNLYYYDVRIQTSSGAIYVLEQGFIKFEPQITQQPVPPGVPAPFSIPIPVTPIPGIMLAGYGDPPLPPPVLTRGTLYVNLQPIPGGASMWQVVDAVGTWKIIATVSF